MINGAIIVVAAGYGSEVSWLAGIGFTMALFIANLAYNSEQINAVKLGILSASVFFALLDCLVIRYFSVSANNADVAHAS